jgi:NAD(P) transhydrogenase
MERFDVLIIGTGPAGHHAAIQAAKVGRKVAICERREFVGGVCIHTGTIPSKTFREAVLYLTGYQQRGLYGSAYRLKDTITIEDLLFRCQHVIRQEVAISHAQLNRNGVEIVFGSARFVGPHHLIIQGVERTTEVEVDVVVIATGTEPLLPDGLVSDGQTLITSDGVLGLKHLPKTMTVIGGGVIGIEYASMFAALGVRVDLIERKDRLLPFVDAEIVESLSTQLRNNGCTIRLEETVQVIDILQLGVGQVTLKSGKKLTSDLILYAMGRHGATGQLDLAAAGLHADDRGRITVDACYRTEVAHIYAAGDIIGFPALASTAMEQGRLAVANALGIHATSVPRLFPYGIYSIPEISMVGKTEQELTAAGIPYEIGISRYREIARGQILGDDSGVFKLLFSTKTRKLLGVHIIGTGATELVHIGQAVMALEGTIDYFVDHVFNYPTFAECYKVAALDAYDRMGLGG